MKLIKMSDYTLKNLADNIHSQNLNKGFYDDYKSLVSASDENHKHLTPFIKQTFAAQRFALITSEVMEALEAMRSDKITDLSHTSYPDIEDMKDTILNIPEDSEFKKHFEERIKDTLEDEIADILIRVLDYAAFRDIDLDFHMEAKLRYNALRPYKHNKLI